MEAVLSYVQLFIALIGQTEHISLFGHCLMECSIENNYLRTGCGNDLLAGSESECVRVVMYGSKLGQTVDLVDNLVCNESCFAEYLSALYYSVTDCGDLVHGLDNGSIACCENFNELLKSFCMSGE